MKTICQIINTLIIITILLGQDSLAIMKYDPKLGLNMNGLINQPKNPIKITEQAINQIIKKTKSYPIDNVESDEIVFMETSVGKLELKLFPIYFG